MSTEEIRGLWSRFSAGEELSADEQRRLVDALEADSGLRDELIENLQLDGVLRELAATRRNSEAFTRTLSDCIGAEHDATRFIRKVELRLGESAPPPSTPPSPGTSRSTKPSTTRIFRRHAASSSPEGSSWKPALIAAAAFLAILLLVTDFTSGSRRTAAATRGKHAPVVGIPTPRNPDETAPVPLPVPEEPRPLRPAGERIRPAVPSMEEKPGDRPRTTPAGDPELRRIEHETTPAVTPRERKTETAPAPVPAIAAVVDRVEGFVYIVRSRTDLRPAKKGDKVQTGWDVETKNGSAVLLYEDGTRVELGAQTAFCPTASGPGRRLVLKSGSLQSQIAKQSANRPLVFVTPQAEATILGTTIRLTASPDPKVGTSLEVQEGKVRFTRLSDAKAVDVAGGQFAQAAAGLELGAQKAFPDEVLVKFGPYDPALKAGQVLDLGEEFTAARGYGWIGAGGEVIGEWLNPGTGVKEIRKSGRQSARRTMLADVDPLKASDIVAGWAGHAETWVMPVPNGRYFVKVSCGDYTFEQGPHHVWVEGKQVIHEKKNKPGAWVEGEDVVEVKDGELTMKVGGNPSPRKSGDGTTDTLINFLVIRKIKK